MKKTLLSLLAIALLFVAVIIVRTFMHQPISREGLEIVSVDVDEEILTRHMSEAIKFKTVSYQSKALVEEEFTGFIEWVKESYPLVNQQMSIELIGGYTLLLKWAGSQPELEPILLTAHYDVVPVIPGSEHLWSYPPFDGKIADGSVWGRGALDDKSAVITLLEAATLLLEKGFNPQRSVYFSFGHDEELGGPQGAGSVVRYARKNGLNFLWSLDEGSFLFKNMIPGVDHVLGTINVAEKGSVTLNIVAKAAGGHSSMPPSQTAVGILAQAITRLESTPVPGGLEGLAAQMFDTASRYMPFSMRMMFANQWLFKGIIEDNLSKSTFMNAMIRTTTAPTMLSASTKVNVLPIEAIATVNFRLHPRDSVEDIVNHVKSIVASDQVEVRIPKDSGRPASRVSEIKAVGYETIERSVYEIHDAAILTPGVMIAGSDTRHYGKVSKNSYRFNPMTVTQKDIATFHGTDESISVANLVLATKIYSRIIQNGSKQ